VKLSLKDNTFLDKIAIIIGYIGATLVLLSVVAMFLCGAFAVCFSLPRLIALFLSGIGASSLVCMAAAWFTVKELDEELDVNAVMGKLDAEIDEMFDTTPRSPKGYSE
jgi:hypothetical protein